MKKEGELFFVFILGVIILTGMVSAVWWNPFTWFNQEVSMSPMVPGVDDNSLRLRIDMDSITNGGIYDSLGSGTFFNTNGVPLVPGKIGNALKFSGDASSYLNGPVVPVSNLNNFAISAWVNPSVPNQNAVFVNYGYDDCKRGDGLHFGMGAGSGNQGNFLVGTSSKWMITSSALSINTWYHIVASKDASGTSFYVNGNKVGGPYSDSVANPTDFRIGGGNGCRFFYGLVDDVMLFNRSLSDSDVLSLYTYWNNYVPKLDCVYTYSTWGECNSSGIQTRTMASSTPAGCSGTPTLSQSCAYSIPQCTDFTYSDWSACGTGNLRFRSVISSSPIGCIGGNPVTNESCAYASECTDFTYSDWSACNSSGIQTRTVLSSSPAGCTGGRPVLLTSCTPIVTAPETCNVFDYSDWSACNSSGIQTRTVLSSSPAGCTGGRPVLAKPCTYVPLAPQTCTMFDYSDWSDCLNGMQTRSVLSSYPSGCIGGTPLLSKSCSCTFGCLTGDNCMPYGYRNTDKYCDVSKQMLSQKAEGKVCSNNYECGSNICADGKCGASQSSIISVIVDVLCTILHPIRSDARAQCVQNILLGKNENDTGGIGGTLVSLENDSKKCVQLVFNETRIIDEAAGTQSIYLDFLNYTGLSDNCYNLADEYQDGWTDRYDYHLNLYDESGEKIKEYGFLSALDISYDNFENGDGGIIYLNDSLNYVKMPYVKGGASLELNYTDNLIDLGVDMSSMKFNIPPCYAINSTFYANDNYTCCEGLTLGSSVTVDGKQIKKCL